MNPDIEASMACHYFGHRFGPEVRQAASGLPFLRCDRCGFEDFAVMIVDQADDIPQ